jgi:ribonuclease PH
MNCVVSEGGEFIEIQGTGEKRPFTRVEGDALLDLAISGTDRLAQFQRQALGL